MAITMFINMLETHMETVGRGNFSFGVFYSWLEMLYSCADVVDDMLLSIFHYLSP